MAGAHAEAASAAEITAITVETITEIIITETKIIIGKNQKDCVGMSTIKQKKGLSQKLIIKRMTQPFLFLCR